MKSHTFQLKLIIMRISFRNLNHSVPFLPLTFIRSSLIVPFSHCYCVVPVHLSIPPSHPLATLAAAGCPEDGDWRRVAVWVHRSVEDGNIARARTKSGHQQGGRARVSSGAGAREEAARVRAPVARTAAPPGPARAAGRERRLRLDLFW